MLCVGTCTTYAALTASCGTRVGGCEHGCCRTSKFAPDVTARRLVFNIYNSFNTFHEGVFSWMGISQRVSPDPDTALLVAVRHVDVSRQ
jgi:hypothetical protein